MIDVFASLYEWFGLMLMYSEDMGKHLIGFDVTCVNYFGTPWYNIVGLIMVATVLTTFFLQYIIIDSPRATRFYHWWLYAIALMILNFIVALSISSNSIQPGLYCEQLNIGFMDCVGFAFSNTIWSLILYGILTSIPFLRGFGNNSRMTTFWKL